MKGGIGAGCTFFKTGAPSWRPTVLCRNTNRLPPAPGIACSSTRTTVISIATLLLRLAVRTQMVLSGQMLVCLLGISLLSLTAASGIIFTREDHTEVDWLQSGSLCLFAFVGSCASRDPLVMHMLSFLIQSVCIYLHIYWSWRMTLCRRRCVWDETAIFSTQRYSVELFTELRWSLAVIRKG